MKGRLVLIVLVVLACVGGANAGSSALAFDARAGGSSAMPARLGQPMIHIRMEAVILSDDDGSDPSGVLTVKQLRQWIGDANSSFSASNANIVLDFNPKTDIAHVKNTVVNHLDHNNDAAASAVAARFPRKYVVLFRAYSGTAVSGNGYTAYNNYNPLGSPGCKGAVRTSCTSSYTVMPSVYCGMTLATDKIDPFHPSAPLGSDASGCGIKQAGWYTYQNFNALVHETGHYFGLPHTFPGSFDFLSTPALLQSWYVGTPRAGTTRSLTIYDGDSPGGPLVDDGTNVMSGWNFVVTDTAPDAGAHLLSDNGLSMCATETKTVSDGSGASIDFTASSYTLHAKYKGKPVTLKFQPDKGDVMSYFMCKKPMTFSASQVQTMRTMLLTDPQRNYLICRNPSDSAFYATYCKRTYPPIPHKIFPHPATPQPNHAITQF